MNPGSRLSAVPKIAGLPDKRLSSFHKKRKINLFSYFPGVFIILDFGIFSV